MKGKIYKLQCNDGHYYIGSTIQPLWSRLSNHKTTAKKCSERKVYKHINGDWENVEILLIEEIECETKEYLRSIEDKYIREALRDMLCLNHYIVARTEEELKEYKKKMSKINYERYKEERTEYKAKWFQSLSKEKKDQLNKQSLKYYHNLTDEQKKSRVERNRLRRQLKKELN
jgi:predicted GIY-YIG superfamily endonuclease